MGVGGKKYARKLDVDTKLFIRRSGRLETQFGQLDESIGSDLFPMIKDVLDIIFDFKRDNPGHLRCWLTDQ